MAARGGKTARRTPRPWRTWRAATGAGPTASRTCARRSGWTRTCCADSSCRGRSRRRDAVTFGHRLREYEPPAARRAGQPLSGVRRHGERGPASYAVRQLEARAGAAPGPHLLCQLWDAAHHRPLTYRLSHAWPAVLTELDSTRPAPTTRRLRSRLVRAPWFAVRRLGASSNAMLCGEDGAGRP